MNILKFFGIKKKVAADKPYPFKDILHLWEDDFLMLELLPNENLEFVKAETMRINNFGQEHFDGTSFTNITPVSEKPVKTIEKLIPVGEIENIMENAGLEKITQFHVQGVGLLEGDKAPLGFGTNRFAVLCDKQNDLLLHISVTGQTERETESQKLVSALHSFGQAFNFIAVNWYQGQYYSLAERARVEDFVKNSC